MPLNQVTTRYIEPGAPWQNPYAESFNGHLRQELLDMESFNTLYEAQLLLEDWRLEYNHYRPHQSLLYQTPVEYARRWMTERTEKHTRTLITTCPKGVRSVLDRKPGIAVGRNRGLATRSGSNVPGSL